MKLFKIHTEENRKDVDLGVHGVYADNEEDAIKYAETEIVADFLSIGYKVEVGRTSKRSIIYSIIYMWDNDEDTKYRKIIIWAIEKEKENTINKVKNKELYEDAVSRAEAKKLAWDLELETCYDNEKVVEMLDELPSVTPVSKEDKWIPCNKQLPKENKYYLVQNEYGDILVAKYVKKDCWEEIYSRHKLGATDKIVAWMPLPKPYKAEMENKER